MSEKWLSPYAARQVVAFLVLTAGTGLFLLYQDTFTSYVDGDIAIWAPFATSWIAFTTIVIRWSARLSRAAYLFRLVVVPLGFSAGVYLGGYFFGTFIGIVIFDLVRSR